MVAAAPGAQATPVYVDLSGTLELPVDVAKLTGQSNQTAASGAATATACGPGSFEADPANRLFRFHDGADSNGCLGVLLNLTLPANARRITVAFAADRAVDVGGGVGAPTLEQELRLRIGTQAIAGTPYFDARDPSKPMTRFALGFEAPAAARDVQLEWWFANRGAPSSATDPAGRLQAWDATVRDPVVRLDDIPLPAPASAPLGGQVQQASYLAGYSAEVWVPAEHRDAAREGRFSLTLRVPGAILVDGLLAPDGRVLAADRYSTSEAPGQRTFRLPPATLQEFGPGPYVLRMQAAETLEVQPTMAALTGVALLMPPAALGLAIHRLRQRVPEQYLASPTDLEADSVAR